jgi:predicted HAD superfamily Cof-like phosphohydrolase
MTTTYQNVKEFMSTFGQERPPAPIIPSLAVRKLRAKLILEEALETIKALGFVVGISNPRYEDYQYIGDSWDDICERNIRLEELHEPNLVEILDGLCDLDYVGTSGTAIACGISEGQMIDAAEEVHRSNMSKLWNYKEIRGRFLTTGNQNPEHYTYCEVITLNQEKDAMYPHLTEEDKIYLVKDKDGKVIKSPSFSPPNLKQILEIKE